MMDQDARKSMLTPPEALSIKPQREGGELWPSKQRVAGSSPAGRARPYIARLCDDSTLSEPAGKPMRPLVDAADAFLLTKRVAGCTAAAGKCRDMAIGSHHWRGACQKAGPARL